MVHYLSIALVLAIAISSSVCARLTRPDRNYYPMQRVLWTILGGVYGGAFVARLISGGVTPPPIGIAFSLLILCGTTYSIAFMKRRNRTPRFIPIDMGGHPDMVPLDKLRAAHEQTASYLRHGAMPADWVAEIDDGRARWQEMEDWRVELARESAARRAARLGKRTKEQGQ